MTADLKVVELYDSNFRDVAATLRVIADEIEAGKYGDVGCCGVVLMGDTVEVFRTGSDSAAPSVASLLYAGFLRLMQPMVDHGRG
jgi:hypothetical protein